MNRESSSAIVDEILGLLDKGEISNAKNMYAVNRKSLHPIDIAYTSTIIKEVTNPPVIEVEDQIQKLLEDYRFEKADETFYKNRRFLDRQAYKKKRDDFEEAYHRQNNISLQSILQKIRKAISLQDFTRAERYYEEIQDIFPRQDFESLLFPYQIEDNLRKFRFAKADELQAAHAVFPQDRYLDLKSKHVTRYFKPIQELSAEQSLAVATDCDNLLIKARAGSGKTRTLAAKAKFIASGYGVSQDHIMVLAFNKKAATAIKQRIVRDFDAHNFENARTFHSLAYQLVNPETKILFDDGTGELGPKDLSNYIRQILRDLWNQSFRAQLITVFRKELGSLKRAKSLLNNREFYIYARNVRDVSLAGQRVKSAGEKFIADFLFEHDIPFTYERIEFWSGRLYKPDFTLRYAERTFIIEHWGIDLRDPKSDPPDWWTLTRKQYLQQIKKKRAYWKDKGIRLIETSVADLRQGRNYFEETLKTKLETFGIRCQRLPQKDLENRVIRWQKDRMTELFVQFIQKAKKQKWTPADVKERIHTHEAVDERERIFLSLSSKVYETYQAKLARDTRLDFDQLLVDAAQKIRQSNGGCCLGLGREEQHQVTIKDLQWILIDEFQDLSFLFFDLIQAIREANPAVKLVCVGDDWQAINGFAGSNLKFMNGFSSHFPHAKTRYLLTNFRSEQQIVASGNALMAGLGKPGRNLSAKDKGEVKLINVDKIYLELRNDDIYRVQNEKDGKFRFEYREETGKRISDNGYLQAKYLKACFDIITEPDNFERVVRLHNKTGKIAVAILSRTNRLYRVALNDFYSKLRSLFSEEQPELIGDFSSKIRLGTVHSFKGLEAEIVIVLRATQGAFPLVHPDTYLFRIFGETDEFGLQEEKRLFYVALSRASRKTYLLTETGNESEYFDAVFGKKRVK